MNNICTPCHEYYLLVFLIVDDNSLKNKYGNMYFPKMNYRVLFENHSH